MGPLYFVSSYYDSQMRMGAELITFKRDFLGKELA